METPDDNKQVKMHPDEIAIGAGLVRALLTEQFPQFASLPLKLVRSTGTVNAIYRLGEHLSVRLPRSAAWAGDIEREWALLPKIGPHISLQIPQPVAKGRPSAGYPHPWAIYRWIEGQPYRADCIADQRQAASDLANFILELRQIDPQDGPPAGRRPLSELDAATRSTIQKATGAIDTAGVSAAWERALEAPAWDGRPLWMHADLLRSNLLVRDGRLCAVIDFGGAGVGDPAFDVVPAWSVFNQNGRATFRSALDVDQGTWARARGYALHQALLIIPYYAETNPRFVCEAKRTVAEVLSELA